MRRLLTVLCLLFMGAAVLPACGGDDEEAAAAKKRAEAVKKKRAKQEAAAKAAAAKKKADEEANIYKYTEKPILDLVPAKPIVGRLFDGAWSIESIVFEPKGDAWTLTFHDKALPRPTAMARDSHPLTVTLSGVPGPGVKFEKNLGVGGATWKLPTPKVAKKAKPAKAAGKKKKKGAEAAPASDAAKAAPAPAASGVWTSRSAYVLEITTWDVKPFDEAGPAFQAAGTASGRIGLVYEGSDGRPNAWVAGQFEGAIVRFMGKPAVPHSATPDPGAADEKKSETKKRGKK